MRKLKSTEKIEAGDFHSFNGSKPIPITNSDGKTVGATPNDFSALRKFYRPSESRKTK